MMVLDEEVHEHTFTRHVGLPVFGGRARAWVDERFVSGSPADVYFEPTFKSVPAPMMYRCTGCGEQGYEVR